MNWRRAGDYAFTADLDAAGWAWEFLRRCPAYRQDHAWFMTAWRGLEADYGAPPHRDFFRWKQDPRAWRAESEIAGCKGACPGEGDQVLIECWMGAKWGIRGFPPDPSQDRPEELAWREPDLDATLLAPGMPSPLEPERVALVFDLSLPLDAQVDSARRRLVASRYAWRRRNGALVRDPSRWTGWLRLLDGLMSGVSLAEVADHLALDEPAGALRDASRLACEDYRRILTLDL